VPFVSCMLKINDAELTEAMRDAVRYVAIVIFLTMAVSDAIDGYLARRKRQVTKLGAFLDPTADKLLITCACLLLSSRRGQVDGFLLPTTVVVLIIGKDVLVLLGFIIVYFMTARVYITPVWAGKIATALQLSMVTAILIAPEVSIFVPRWIWFLQVLWWAAAGSAVLATFVYIRNGSRYIEQHEQANS